MFYFFVLTHFFSLSASQIIPKNGSSLYRFNQESWTNLQTLWQSWICHTWCKYEIAFIKELDKYETKFMITISMSKRVTIVLDDDLVKKLSIQSKKIAKSKGSISFSSIVNDELRKTLKWKNNSWVNYHFALDVGRLELQVIRWSVLIVRKITINKKF